MLIQAHNLSVVREGRKVLQNVSLEIQEGDFITIIGPNGAGKSTLLKVMMGLLGRYSGRIKRKTNLRLGYVPQSLRVESTLPMTVRYFLQLRKECSAKVLDNIMEQTGCQGLEQRQLSELSGGELQRVLLTRSLLGQPELLVLDEPAQHLDVGGQLAFYRMVERIYREQGLSVIMVSHDLHWVMASTSQVVCLFHHICCSGKPQAVAQDPSFLALFGNDMAGLMSFYPHSHDHSHDCGEQGGIHA